MKINIHPEWYPEAQVACACGNTFVTGSTKPEIRVDICSNCHPLFTGQSKLVDTLGQVDKFQKRTAEAKQKQAVRKEILERRALKIQKRTTDRPSLKDLLMQARKQSAS